MVKCNNWTAYQIHFRTTYARRNEVKSPKLAKEIKKYWREFQANIY